METHGGSRVLKRIYSVIENRFYFLQVFFLDEEKCFIESGVRSFTLFPSSV